MKDYFLRILGSLVAMFLAGFCNQVLDIAGNYAWYGQSIFPAHEPGSFWGTQSETWLNKWAINEAGAPIVGTERFFLSSTLLVWITDLWHASKSAMLLAFQVAVILYRQPEKKIFYLADLVALKIAFSAGWYAGNLILR